MKTIQQQCIDNRDTLYTVDMYHIFNGEEAIDFLIDDYNETNNTDYNYDDFDFDFDTRSILEGLALRSISYIKETKDSDIIKSVSLLDVHSPKYYNYTTDSYTMEVEYDHDLLNVFLKTHEDEYKKYIDGVKKENGATELDTEWGLLFYINYNFDNDEYMNHMLEVERELWFENTKYTLIKETN